MSEPLCRVSVQVDEDDLGTVDLALPRKTHVGLLMPAIVDIVHRGENTLTDVRRWRLARVGGQRIDEWTTLDDNEIHDGELLVVTNFETPEPDWIVDDPCHAVASVADGGHERVVRITAVAACLCAAVAGATALAWAGVTSRAAGHLIVGVGLAVAAAAGAVVIRRSHPDSLPSVTLSVVAVVFAAAAGFLAVPAGPSVANFLLAAAAGFSTSILLLRLSRCGTTCLTALATISALAAAALTVGVIWTLPAAAVGAVLVTVSVVMLSTAARLTIAASSLAPPMPSIDDGTGDEHVVDAARAVLAHQSLTGLVVGSSAAASLGIIMVAAGGWARGSFFTAAAGVVLLLRARTHVGTTRRIALIATGLIALTAGFAAAVVSAPEHAHWMSTLATGAGSGALAWVFGSVTISPVVRRAVDVTEYLALAGLVPLACWVIDLYGLVRGASLT